jgi:GH24 family phage-related lysozyme (muramidase)
MTDTYDPLRVTVSPEAPIGTGPGGTGGYTDALSPFMAPAQPEWPAPPAAPAAAPAGGPGITQPYVDAIKRLEGYTPDATWDYRQWSNGYGTRALHPHERIDEAEAERRLQRELGRATEIVDRAFPGLPEGPRSALTSLTYNAGASWMGDRLGTAVRAGDWNTAQALMQQYNHAGGQVLPGLTSRRAEEGTWMAGADPYEAPTTTAARSYPTERAPRGYIGPAVVDDNGNVAFQGPQGTLYTDNTRHEIHPNGRGGFDVWEKGAEPWGPTPRTASPASARRVGPQPAPQSLWEQGIPQTIGRMAAAPFELPPPGSPESYVPWGVKTFLNAATGGLPGLERSALGAFGGRGFHLPPFEPNPRAIMGGNMPPSEFRLEPAEMPPAMEGGNTVQLVPHEEGRPPLWMHEVPGELPEEAHVPVGHGPEHELSSVPLLSDATPTQAPRSRDVWDIAKGLHQRGLAALRKMGITQPLTAANRTAETDEILARTLAHETKAAMARSGHAGDWYTRSVEDAVNAASVVYPEIAGDPNARFAFLAAHAITSQNETVSSNVRLAQQAYEHYKRTGRFPTDIKSSKQKLVNGNFEKMNGLLDGIPEKGIAGMTPAELRAFMNKEYSVRDLDAMGFNMSDFAKDDVVPGSAILGPKIGHGFFQNLNGNYNPVTVDLWYMRTHGRFTGTLSGTPSAVPKARGRLERALEEAGHPVPGNIRSLSSVANRIVLQHERDYRAWSRTRQPGDQYPKSELVLAAERVQQNLHGIKETPSSAAERRWITSVVNRTRELLEKEGHTMTNADIQAALWYPEKDIYAKLGGRPSEEINLSYADAWRNVLRQHHGMSDEQIDTAIRALERGY